MPVPAMSGSGSAGGQDVWMAVKELWTLVDDAVVRKLPGIRPDLQSGLHENSHLFKKLLINPARSKDDLASLKKAPVDGIRLPVLASQADGADGESHVRKIPSQIIDEALILADLFDLNELSALQLILLGEERLCDHPGLTRGLVAVLTYYDTRKTVVETLRALILGCQGVTWTLETSDDISSLVTEYIKQLVEENNLVSQILALIKSSNWSGEANKLSSQMALGDAKHRSQVEELFRGVEKGLAQSLFALSAQQGLSIPDTVKVMDFLASNVRLDTSHPETCSLGDVDMGLVMALLYAIDVSRVPQLSEGELSGVRLPLLDDPKAVSELHREIFSPGGSSREWNHEGVSALVRFAWAMTLAGLRSNQTGSAVRPDVAGIVDDDEAVLDSALASAVFHWLSKSILLSPSIAREEFYLRRFHALLTDVLVQMPLKVKELRNRADDAARNKLMHEQEGIQFNVPLQGQHFEQLMCSVAQLYSTTTSTHSQLGGGGLEDSSILHELVLDYWCPVEMSGVPAVASSGTGVGERYSSRQISLYKFLRLAGDLLMPSLYTPYIQMLASLSKNNQASLHCFNLLKLNGMGSGGNAISWDHFFSSLHQYFVNLRQEVQVATSDTIYRLRSMTKGISPAEISGLAAVLRLVTVVSDYSEPARLAFAQRPEWQPIPVMVGLLGCSVPSVLKSEILKALSSLSKSPEIALDVWNALEASNFIAVSSGGVPSNATSGVAAIVPGRLQKGGFLLELETVETQAEEYPMTLAFLTLMDTLMDHYSFILGSNSGNPTAIAAFNTFSRLLVDDIFLNFYNKSYKNLVEKWQIAEACLKIINRFVSDDTLLGGLVVGSIDASAPRVDTGSRILTHLNQPSELLRLMLHILDEGCSAVESYIKFPGKTNVEKSCLQVLQILRRVLELQPQLMKAARESTSDTGFLTGLDKLLLGVNPRTGKADYILTLAKFIASFTALPSHTVEAINLLNVISSPANQVSLLGQLNVTDAAAKIIIKGATDVIDSGMLDNELVDGAESGSGGLERKARLALIDLLQKCSNFPAPNLTHFFMGFDLTRVAQSNIKPPGGAMGTVRSPLHAMIACLQAGAEPGMESFSFIERSPQSADAVLKLLYTLSCNLETSGAILRYLHSSDQFFITQLQLYPIKLPLDATSKTRAQIMRAQAWLMKSSAIQLKNICQSRLRSQLTTWINLLLSPTRNLLATGSGGNADDYLEANDLNQLSHHFKAKTTTNSSQHHVQGGHMNRLLTILNSMSFEEISVAPPEPALEVFDMDLIKGVLNKCRSPSSSGALVIDITGKLHPILRQEMETLNSVNQRQQVRDEVDSILRYAMRLNCAAVETEARKSLLDAWRQVTEIMFCCTPTDILGNSQRQQILLELLQTLLNKVLTEGASTELTSPVSGIVLLLMTALRQTYRQEGSGDGGTPSDDTSGGSSRAGGSKQFVPVLDATLGSSDTRVWGGGAKSSSIVYPTALQVVLRGIVTWISSTSSIYQRVRANLYGGLLNYLRIGRDNNSAGDSVDHMRLKKSNLEVLSGFGDVLIEIICRDTVAGHDVRRILSLALLDELIALDSSCPGGGGGVGGGTWMWYISREGYLKNIIETLVRGDNEMVNLLVPNGSALTSGADDAASTAAASALQQREKYLYTYESKMAFFTRMASSVAGAELLLESGLMVRLAEMRVFSARPEATYQISSAASEATPRSLQVYRQILFPALRLCLAVLSCLGSNNVSAVVHVKHFVKANEQVFRSILHPPNRESVGSVSGLEEICLLTGVLAKTGCSSDHGEIKASGEDSLMLKQQMLSLIHHYDASPHLIEKSVELVGKAASSQVQAALLQISVNLHMFVRAMAAGSGGVGASNKKCQIIFSPKASSSGVGHEGSHPIPHRTTLSAPVGGHDVVLAGRPLSLGQVVRSVQSLGQHYIRSHSQTTLSRKGQEELGSAIESTLWVVWKHAEFFSRKSATASANEDAFDLGAAGNSLGLDSANITRELRSVFTDEVFMQLLDVDKLLVPSTPGGDAVGGGFINTLVRRLKRIVAPAL